MSKSKTVKEIKEREPFDHSRNLVPFLLFNKFQFDGAKLSNLPAELLDIQLNGIIRERNELIKQANNQRFYN